MKRRSNRQFNLKPEEKLAIVQYLKGELGLTDLAEALGYNRKSPQPAANLVAAICRQWVYESKLEIKLK